jgi:hypothetical protein
MTACGTTLTSRTQLHKVCLAIDSGQAVAKL